MASAVKEFTDAEVFGAPKEMSDAEVFSNPSMLDRAGRQVGLAARAGVTGLTSIPAIGADVLGTILNLGIDAYNKTQTPSMSDLVTGKKQNLIPRFEPTMGKIEQNLSAAGLPEPNSPTENIVYKINQALTGQSGLLKAGGLLAKSANPTTAGVGTVLSARPGVQLQAAGGAGTAGAVAHELNLGPVAEFLASLTGGAIVPAATSIAKGVPAFVQPFTTAGQRKIAGNVLADAATSPADAQAALSAGSAVPGVSPTMSMSRDPGLASLERSLSAKPAGASLHDRYLQNNAARSAELDNLAGTAGDITRAENARNAATVGTRDAAMAGAKIGAPSDAVVANIDSTLKSPKGNREVVNQALSWAKDRIQGVTDPERLYEIRKDINDAMNGKLAGDKSAYRLASSELIKVRNQLDDAIESDAPGFKAYLQQYKDASKPINQMEVLQEIRNRVQGTGEDRLGNRQILPSAMQRTMDNLDEVAASVGIKKAKAEDILTPQQMTRLEALRKDLADTAFSQAGGKVSGSNTMQLSNYSTANIIGRMTTGQMGPITRNLGRGLDWLNKINDRDIDLLLIEAAKDPALAGTLMKGASADRIKLASDGLEQLAKSMGIGDAAATASAERTHKKASGKAQ